MTRRVLMIAPTPFFSDRGCHVRILEEARALESIGYTVKIVTYPNGNDPDGIDVERVGKWTGYDKPEAGPHWFKPFLDILLLAKSICIAAKFKPDIVHGHLHEGCAIGWPVAKIAGAPLVFDYQGGFSKEIAHHGAVSEGGLVFKILAAFESFIDRLADAVMPSSESFAANIDVKEGRLFHLQDAVSIAEFASDPNDAERKRYVPDGAFPVVFLGLLNSYQGADVLLDAIAELKKKSSRRYVFLLMGYPNEDIYAKKAADLGVSAMVIFTGRVAYKDAGRMLRLGKIAVGPKIAATESNGKLIDYMACGLPTIAFDTPVNRDIMGDAGVYAAWDGDERKGAGALAEAIEKLASDETKMAELAKKGVERVSKRFGREGLAKRLAEIYDIVVARKK